MVKISQNFVNVVYERPLTRKELQWWNEVSEGAPLQCLIGHSQRFIPSIGNIEKSYASSQMSGQTGLFLAVLKFSAILVMYTTLRVVFSCFHGQNRYQIRVLA